MPAPVMNEPTPDPMAGVLSQPQMTPEVTPREEVKPPADVDYNAKQFDLPVPGQSWTAAPGSMSYEQPPQFTNLSKAMDYMVNRLTSPSIQTNVLRMLDAGVPVETLLTPIIMHGASEGKFNMDLAMMMIEPLAVVINGIGHRAGIPVKMTVPRREKIVDQKPLEKIFKKENKNASKPELITASPMDKEKPKGLLAKPGMA